MEVDADEVDDLAADIRLLDGDHKMGAAALAEALVANGWTRAPKTERVTFSPPNNMFGNRFAAHLIAATDFGGSASKALYEQFSLVMVKDSWETREGSDNG